MGWESNAAVYTCTSTPQTANDAGFAAPTFLAGLQTLSPLIEAGLWPAQIVAIHNLENSLKANKPRALIQMATGSGKTFTSISFIYRLIKFAGDRRVLFLVDRSNLGRQIKKEFDQFNRDSVELLTDRGLATVAHPLRQARGYAMGHTDGTS